MSEATFKIENAAGTNKIPDSWSLLGIDIIREVNRIPSATLTLGNDEIPAKQFEISDSSFFNLGNEIKIIVTIPAHGQKPAKDETLFQGLVISQTFEADIRYSILKIGLKDSAIKMIQSRKSKVTVNTTDQEVIKTLITDNNLSYDPNSDAQFPVVDTKFNIIQYNCSDWDFMLTRAETNGLLVSVADGVISLNKIELGNVKETYQYGISEIYSLEIEANANGQYAAVTSSGWDIQKQAMTEPVASNALKVSPGDIDSVALATSLGDQNYALTSPAPLAASELGFWRDATMARSRLALIRGRISLEGNNDVQLMDTIAINDVGKHFFESPAANTALVTGLRHRVTDKLGWVTDLQFGLADEWFASRPNIAPLPAAGIIPPINGLQIGLIDDYEPQNNDQYMVKVNIPALGVALPPQEGQAQSYYSVMARLALPDAGNQRGVYVRPKPGDEVVLGFFNNDPRQPVVIGSLYSSTKPPSALIYDATKANNKLGWISTNLAISFDDGTKQLSIGTLENNAIKNSLVIDGTNNTITIQLGTDGKNKIAMNADGVTITCPNFKVDATDSVNLSKGGQAIVKSAG